MTDQPEDFDLRSLDIAAEKKEELLRLFPEVRTEDGRIDFERLRLALGEMVDAGRERYGMNWPGKADCFRAIQTPSLGTLRPCPEESVNFDTSENLIIEGDNLEVLKLLQKAYLGKVKMIYIDPPYNTGNDFIYPDNYSESLRTYLEYTGQVDGEGRKFGTNSDTGGRFHSRWMNMMYPRLYLARNLLRDDGVIFISIDDNEVANLRKVCDEIFGEENFIANVIWEKKYTRSNDAKYFSDNHDHILVYARQKDIFKLYLQSRTVEQDAAYSNPDSHPKGPWKATPLHAKSGSNTQFTYTFKNGVTWSPPKGTYPRFSFETLAVLDVNDEIWFGENGQSIPSRKTFLSEAKEGVTPTTLWPYSEVGHNHEANNELKELGLTGIFENPKPSRLIKRMIELSTRPKQEEIILDFFAGAGTTAHAVFDFNKVDGVKRKFILIQLPEPCEKDTEAAKASYKTIADITKERVRRVIQKISRQMAEAKEAEKKKPPELFSSAPSAPAREPDLGFRVFKLAESNFKPWEAGASRDAAALDKQLELHVDHLRDDRSELDILFEILLKSGFPLATPVETWQVCETCQVYRVGEGKLLICLEEKLTMEAVRTMADLKPERVVCLDRGFEGNDQLKANAVHIFKDAGISSFKTV